METIGENNQPAYNQNSFEKTTIETLLSIVATVLQCYRITNNKIMFDALRHDLVSRGFQVTAMPNDENGVPHYQVSVAPSILQ